MLLILLLVLLVVAALARLAALVAGDGRGVVPPPRSHAHQAPRHRVDELAEVVR